MMTTTTAAVTRRRRRRNEQHLQEINAWPLAAGRDGRPLGCATTGLLTKPNWRTAAVRYGWPKWLCCASWTHTYSVAEPKTGLIRQHYARQPYDDATSELTVCPIDGLYFILNTFSRGLALKLENGALQCDVGRRRFKQYFGFAMLLGYQFLTYYFTPCTPDAWVMIVFRRP